MRLTVQLQVNFTLSCVQYACLKRVLISNTSTGVAAQHLFLHCLHIQYALNYSDAVCYTTRSTNTFSPFVLFVGGPNMINATFVNNPCRRHTGNLSQYSTVTKLLFKLLQCFEALIFLALLIFVVDFSSYKHF